MGFENVADQVAELALKRRILLETERQADDQRRREDERREDERRRLFP